METYTITIIGRGKEADAKVHALACLAALTKASHTVLQARLSVDKGGMHDLMPEPEKRKE